MFLPFGLILFGAILLTAAIKNQSLLDTALAKKNASPLTGDGGGSGGPPSGVAPAAPGATLAAGNNAPKGLVQMDGHPVAAWIAEDLRWSRAHGYWKGQVTSGWRDPNEVVTPSAGLPVAAQGQSNHRGKAWPLGAVDVTDPDGLEAAQAHYPGILKLKRGTAIDDPVHFSWTGR